MSFNVTPSEYLDFQHPASSPEDFIGEGHVIAEKIKAIIEKAKSSKNRAIKMLLSGKPGVGKTCLALYAINLLGGKGWNVSRISGADVTVDYVRQLSGSLNGFSEDIFGEYRIILINETDAIPEIAQVRFLDLMDCLKPGTAIIATTNKNVNDLEERFQTRFKTFFSIEKGATSTEIKNLLVGKWELPEKIAEQIAVQAKGCIRVALNEAEEWLCTTPVC